MEEGLEEAGAEGGDLADTAPPVRRTQAPPDGTGSPCSASFCRRPRSSLWRPVVQVQKPAQTKALSLSPLSLISFRLSPLAPITTITAT